MLSKSSIKNFSIACNFWYKEDLYTKNIMLWKIMFRRSNLWSKSYYNFSGFFHGNLQFSGSVSLFLQFVWLLELFGMPLPTISLMIISEHQNMTKIPKNVFNTYTSKGPYKTNLYFTFKVQKVYPRKHLGLNLICYIYTFFCPIPIFLKLQKHKRLPKYLNYPLY